MIDIQNIEITKEILQIIAKIDEFKGAWNFYGKISPDRLKVLKKVATIESIGSSTRIEGSKLSDEEIEALLSNTGKQSFLTRDEQEVAGYAFVCDEIFNNYENIPFTENIVKQLHLWLLKYSDKDKYHRSNYKKVSNQIEAFDEMGKSLGIIFKTTEPFETPIKMNELINWTNNALEKKILHPILIIAIFVLYFLAIHPFQDGNGRLSRILTTLLLLKTGYAYISYISLESIIEENKDNYYISLRKTQKTIVQDKINLSPWINFFLKCLQKQKQVLEKKMVEEKILFSRLSQLSCNIVKILKEHGQLKTSEIEKLLKANRNTLKKHLQNLVKTNHIVRHGKGKATWYTFI